MATGTRTLYPNPLLQGGPTVTMADGWLVVTKPNGRTARFATRGSGSVDNADAVATLAHHTTTMRPPSGDGVRLRAVTRSSWRLLNRDGKPLVWLANSDQVLYDFSLAREFAAAGGLEFRDFGVVQNGDLVSTRPVSPVNGPGTGRRSSTVAPGRHWGITAAMVAGVSLVVPLADAFWTDGGLVGVGAVVVVVGVLTLAIAAPAAAGYLAAGLGALRWQGYWRRQPTDPRILLTARRHPGLVLSAGSDRLEIRDLRRTHVVSGGDALALQPYEIAGDGARRASGLLVRGSGQVVAHIPARFDPAEVHAFAGELGARSLPLLDRAEQVPKPRSRRQGARAGSEGRVEAVAIRRAASYAGGVLAWTLTAASPFLAATAGAILAGWLPLPRAYAMVGIAPVLLMIGTWTLYATQTPIWLRRPDRVVPSVPRQPRQP